MDKKKIGIIIVAAVAVIAAVVIVLLVINSGNAAKTNNTASTVAASAGQTEASAADGAGNAPVEADEDSGQEPQVGDHHDEADTTTPDIALPSQNGEASYFSGSYAPDVRAEDISTGQVVHLRELFGTNYAYAALTFNEDGTFSDSLISPEARSGRYRVEDGSIVAVYLPDETLDITVTEWSEEGKPVTFCVVYKTFGEKGYKVFYSEK